MSSLAQLRCSTLTFLSDEDGGSLVEWMYPLLLGLVLVGASSGSLGREWKRTWASLTSGVAVTTLGEFR